LADQLVEEGLLLGVGVGGILGVPLGSHHPAGRVELDRVDQPVGVVADHVQAVTESIECLMVNAMASLGPVGSHGLGDP